MSGAGEKYDDGDKDLAPEVKRMKSSFEKTDIALIVDGKRLYINRNELMEKSPVFKKMLTADFKERNALKIELPKKDLHHFLMFLRCTLDGHDDQINNINVHCIIPIAHEYQVKETLDKANIFLSNEYLQRSLRDCLSTDIINGIIEAEKYGLTRTLKELIDRASRKKFKTFSKTSDFDAISKGTLYKISMARWQNDIDVILVNHVHLHKLHSIPESETSISNNKKIQHYEFLTVYFSVFCIMVNTLSGNRYQSID